MYGTKSAEAQSSFDDVILFARVVSSGSITINEDSSVQILAEEACSVDQLDAQVRSTETHVAISKHRWHFQQRCFKVLLAPES